MIFFLIGGCRRLKSELMTSHQCPGHQGSQLCLAGVGSHDAGTGGRSVGWWLGWVAGLGYHQTLHKYFLPLLQLY